MDTKKSLALIFATVCGFVVTTSAQAQVSERTLRFSTAVALGHPIVLGAEKFGEIIKQKSGGKMTVKVFAGGTLGGDLQALSAVQGGTVDMTCMNSGILQSQAKEFAVLDFPFLFDSAKEADAVVDGPIGNKLADKLPAKGLVNLAYWELGFRHLSNNKRPVTKMEDLQGLKLRVIQSPIYIDAFSALGTNPVPLPFPEVYTALETKVVDGQENPLAIIALNKFQEVQKHLTLSRHIYNPQSLLMSKKTWDKLSKEEQEIVVSAAMETRLFQRKLARDSEAQSLAELKKSMQVTELPAEETAKIRTKLKPVLDKYSSDIGPDIVKQLYAEIDKVRGK